MIEEGKGCKQRRNFSAMITAPGSLNPQAFIRVNSIPVHLLPPAADLNADIRVRMIRGEALIHTGSMLERENIDRFACYVAAIT
jgi:hypothetical protein